MDSMPPARRPSRRIRIGWIPLGDGAPIAIQSMTNTATHEVDATLAQIRELAAAGCDIVRVAVPDVPAADALPALVANTPLPLVADIHFRADLALRAIAAGAHGLRLNPGNIAAAEDVARIASRAADAGVPIRVGVNGGSLSKDQRARTDDPAEALVLAALDAVEQVRRGGCDALKVSLKSSSVRTTVEAYRRFADRSDLPLHVGVTEAGTVTAGTIKSAVGIGALLLDGIGDTLRVSLTAPPVEEVHVARRILQATGHLRSGPEVVACPTCGRTRIELIPLVQAVEAELARLQAAGRTVHLDKIAVMGCIVNGPGEARDADVGIAGGDGRGALFRKGRIVQTLPAPQLLPALLAEIRRATEPEP